LRLASLSHRPGLKIWFAFHQSNKLKIMKKTLLILSLLLLASACARTQSGVSAGLISSWKDTISGSVNNSVELKKQGEACAVNVLGIVAVGDSSIEAAKKSGPVEKVAFADTTYLNILGIYQQGCTVVKGE
jgi:hypothetical protein